MEIKTYWAIQSTISGNLLPLPRQFSGAIAGFSHVEFGDGGLPRLFSNEESARAAMVKWAQGKWKRANHEGIPELIKNTSRDRSNLRVIPIQLRYDRS
jgi:hypothetical protein